MFRLVRCFLVVMPVLWLFGCHNPARQSVPQATPEQREAEWRKELTPGMKADRAMAYLLTQRFPCQITRDDRGRVVRIVSTPPRPLRDASGIERSWQIDLAVQEDLLQTVKIRPLPVR